MVSLYLLLQQIFPFLQSSDGTLFPPLAAQTPGDTHGGNLHGHFPLQQTFPLGQSKAPTMRPSFFIHHCAGTHGLYLHGPLQHRNPFGQLHLLPVMSLCPLGHLSLTHLPPHLEAVHRNLQHFCLGGHRQERALIGWSQRSPLLTHWANLQFRLHVGCLQQLYPGLQLQALLSGINVGGHLLPGTHSPGQVLDPQ